MKLSGVYYHYKPVASYSKLLGLYANDTNRHIGFIAQEVKDVIQEVVDTTNFGTMGINYAQLIALLTAGIQQQQGEINALKIQIRQCCDKVNPNGKKDTVINLGKTSSTSIESQQYFLFQNQPNPFSIQTLINYQTPLEAKGISVFVFNLQGELIKS
ncbi:MAG: tail fiber domain-containing protein [bacterium]|nr:tail fiber domain-containing protein [bacterium]